MLTLELKNQHVTIDLKSVIYFAMNIRLHRN